MTPECATALTWLRLVRTELSNGALRGALGRGSGGRGSTTATRSGVNLSLGRL